MTDSDLLIGLLATWRIAHLFVYESGPGKIFARIRSYAIDSNSGLLIGVLGCIWCLSIWVGLAVSAVVYIKATSVLWPFALSAGAILVNSYATRNDNR